jgi:GTP cyclohydrolase I
MAFYTAGVKDIHLPIRVMQKDGGVQDTVASVSLHTRIGAPLKPNCISSFTRILNRYINRISVAEFSLLLKDVKECFNAERARIEMRFPYYLEKKAPVTGTSSLMEYSCTFSGGIGAGEGFILTVQVPVTTLCPCSKEISDAGAHNQRAEVTLSARFSKNVWAEDLIELIEQSASCELFALLKRPDEKYVTEVAFKNPMFVEDVVRKVAVHAFEHPDITSFSASVESFESIHKHSAYAYVDSGDILKKNGSAAVVQSSRIL